MSYILETCEGRTHDCFVGGLETGEILIKPAIPLLTNENIEVIKPNIDYEIGPVTCIKGFNKN